MSKPSNNSHISHYCGIGLLSCIAGITFLVNQTLTYEGNDLAQAGILIGILGSIATLLVGVISGIALGKNMAQNEANARETELLPPPL